MKAKAFGVPTCKYCGSELDDDVIKRGTESVCPDCSRKAKSYKHGCFIVVSVPEGESRAWLGGHFRKFPKDGTNTQGLPEGLKLEYWEQGAYGGLYEVTSVLRKCTPGTHEPRGDGVFVGPRAK